MEEKREDQGINNGRVTSVESEVPSHCRVAPRTENNDDDNDNDDNNNDDDDDNNNNNPNPNQTAPVSSNPCTTYRVILPFPVSEAPPGNTGSSSLSVKKRGRPRKYGPDGAVLPASVLSPKPISSFPSPSLIDFLAGPKEKVRPVGSATDDQLLPCSVSDTFMPHSITVNTGEDVIARIRSFSQHGPRSICILSAHGFVSNVTLRQPHSFGGTLTYEGRFEILSLNGSFRPSENGGGTNNTSSGLSISLVNENGGVIGGRLAGLLVAASPVQIMVGSFLTPNQNELKSVTPTQDI